MTACRVMMGESAAIFFTACSWHKCKYVYIAT